MFNTPYRMIVIAIDGSFVDTGIQVISRNSSLVICNKIFSLGENATSTDEIGEDI